MADCALLIRPTPGASSLRSNSNVELIAAADVHLADPDLRHAGASADLGDHLRAPGVVEGYVDVLEGHTPLASSCLAMRQ
jgi:hypothetical protein